MPGVPSGRGCEACRKQKKKCDQLTPICSRCNRLHILCVGSGQQRYKFLESDGSSKSSSNRLVHRSRKHSPSLHGEKSKELSVTPSNETTLIVDALIAKLKARDDLRYHISWAYGGFIEDIPRRLGTNEAFDAAVGALVCAHTRVGVLRSDSVGTQSLAKSSLVKYNHALKTLRISLDDPVKAREANTLGAVMLLLICQGFVGNADWGATHCEGAAQILKARGYYNPQDEFESKLLLSLRGPVVFEALLNSKIRFSHDEWKTIVENELDGSTTEGLMMRCLARVPDLMQRGRTALDTQRGVQEVLADTRHQYSMMKSIVAELRDRLDTVEELTLSGMPKSAVPLARMRLHAHYQRTHGLALAITLIFNCILNGLGSEQVDLDVDLAQMCEATLELADQAARYRPIGASYVTLCLIAAWAGCRDGATRAEVERTLVDYQSEFPGMPPDMQTFRAQLGYTFQRLHLLQG